MKAYTVSDKDLLKEMISEKAILGIGNYVYIPSKKIILNVHYDISVFPKRILGYTMNNDKNLLSELEYIVRYGLENLYEFELLEEDLDKLTHIIKGAKKKSSELSKLEENFKQICASLFDRRLK